MTDTDRPDGQLVATVRPSTTGYVVDTADGTVLYPSAPGSADPLAGVGSVTVDLTALGEPDEQFVLAMIRLHNLCRTAGVPLTLANPTERVRSRFAMHGLGDMFTPRPDHDPDVPADTEVTRFDPSLPTEFIRPVGAGETLAP